MQVGPCKCGVGMRVTQAAGGLVDTHAACAPEAISTDLQPVEEVVPVLSVPASGRRQGSLPDKDVISPSPSLYLNPLCVQVAKDLRSSSSSS